MHTMILAGLLAPLWAPVASAGGWSTEVFVEGATLSGGANGMAFDAQDRLFIANVFGDGITVLDPDTGEVIERLGPPEGALVPDDLAFGPDGSLFWTNPAGGTISRRTSGPDGQIGVAGGQTTVIAEGRPRANPIVVDGSGRVFAAQCFHDTTGVFEVLEAQLRPVVEGVAGCASNGMAIADGILYTPRWFERRILGLDPDTGEVRYTLQTEDVPAAVAVHQGELFWVSQDSGRVYAVQLPTPEPEPSADLVEGADPTGGADPAGDAATGAGEPPVDGQAVAPVRTLAVLEPGLDNLAFDSRGRLFVSSAVDGSVHEVLPDEVRQVVAGGMIAPMGIAVIGERIHVGEPQSVRSFDLRTGKPRQVTSSTFGVGELTFTTGISAASEELILSSWVTGEIQRFEPGEGEVLATIQVGGGPAAVAAWGEGLLVAQMLDGTITHRTGASLSEARVIASLPGATGIAAYERDVYATSVTEGTVVKIADRRGLVEPPEVIADGLAQPEGLVVLRGGKQLAVVEAGAGQVRLVHARSGRSEVIAGGLGLRANPPGLGGYWLDGITLGEDDALYVNGDEANVIYRIARD